MKGKSESVLGKFFEYLGHVKWQRRRGSEGKIRRGSQARPGMSIGEIGRDRCDAQDESNGGGLNGAIFGAKMDSRSGLD